MFGLFRRQTSFGKIHRAPRSAKPQRTTLQVETLEDRCTPSIDPVTSKLDDGGPGTLRSVIANASSGDTIVFNPGVTGSIALNPVYGPISTNKALTITGPGSGILAIDAQKNSGIFYFTGTAADQVSISGLTLENGNSSARLGGAIFSSVNLTLNNTALTGNTSIRSGGAVYEKGGPLTIMNSVLTGNYAFGGGGGAVYDYGGGALNISGCNFDTNKSYDQGGAVAVGPIAAYPATTVPVTIQDSIFTGNTCVSTVGGGYGGAVCDYANGTLNISGCTFNANSCYGDGGAVFAGPAVDGSAITNDLTIQDSTFTGNTAAFSSFAGGVGGAICDYANGTLSISGCTFTTNTAYTAGGAVHAGLDYGLRGTGPALISVSIQDSTFTGNVVPRKGGGGPGGAVAVFYDSGTLNISGCTFTNNSCASSPGGGAVYAGGFTSRIDITIQSSTFSGNTAGGFGGAITDYSNTGILQVSDCNFDQNSGVDGGAIAIGGGPSQITATIQGSTFTSNSATGGRFRFGGSGGAIYAYAPNDPLNILGCTFSQNSAKEYGGAVFAAGGEGGSGSVVIQGSTLSGNNSKQGGGGITVESRIGLSISESTISGNSVSSGRGGGIEAYNAASVSITDSTISGNNASEGGGGLDVAHARSLNISGSTISGNSAKYGGGIYLYHSPSGAVIQNCTIVNNHALYSASVPVSNSSTGGGGLLLYTGSLTIQNCTITNNTAGSFGGGIWVKGDDSGSTTADLILESTIVSGNTDSTGAEDIGRYTGSTLTTIEASDDLFSTYPSIGSSGVLTTSNANLFNTDPLLGPLTDNGGPTLTMALAPNSPAIDKGSNPAGLAFDQRDTPFVRTFGSGTDIGAVEFQPFTTITGLSSSVNPVDLGHAVTFTATVTNTMASSVVPTGTVTFFDGSTMLGTVTLTNGIASFTTSSLGVGTHPITAVYNGQVGFMTFSPSTSPVLNEVVESPTPPLPPLPLIAVGSDAGIPAEVKVYNAQTGALVFDLLPFGGFTGGVRVAVGDVNGDGVADIICGAGSGGGPQVVVYDGSSGQMIRSFYGLAQNFTGGIYVAAGDVNGDGLADIIVGAGAGGGSQVAVWSGKDGSLLETFYAFAPRFSGGVRVAAGDVNGDGFADIITAAGPGGGPQVTVFNGVNLGVLLSFNAYAPGFSGGVFVAAGDVNGDGFADIITGPGSGGGPQIAAFSGKDATVLFSFNDPRFSPNVTEPGVSTGVRVGSLAVNGLLEILAAPGPGSPALVDVFSAQNLGLLDEFFAFNQGFLGGVFVGG